MNSQPFDPPDRLSEQPITKRPYSAPVLVAWGSLRDITLAIGSHGKSDGGKGKQPRRTR